MCSLRFIYSFLFLGLVFLAGSCKKSEVAPPTVSLLTNGDIEQQLQGWSFGSSSAGNVNSYSGTVTTEAASSPTHSLKITCASIQDSTAFSYFTQQHLAVDQIAVGTKLTLRANIKTALKGPGVSLVIRGDAGNQVVMFASTQGKTSITGTQDFTSYSVVVDSYLGGVDNLHIFLVFLAGTTGTAYLDDISLQAN